jgi:hypothetical protein
MDDDLPVSKWPTERQDTPRRKNTARPLTRKLSLLLLAATVLPGCSNEPEYSDQQRACIAKLYSSYDAKQMNRCANV